MPLLLVYCGGGVFVTSFPLAFLIAFTRSSRLRSPVIEISLSLAYCFSSGTVHCDGEGVALLVALGVFATDFSADFDFDFGVSTRFAEDFLFGELFLGVLFFDEDLAGAFVLAGTGVTEGDAAVSEGDAAVLLTAMDR